MQRKKRTLFAVCMAAVALAAAIALWSFGAFTPEWQTLHQKAGTRITQTGTPGVGSIGGEWAVIGLSRSGQLDKDTADKYLQQAENYVRAIDSDRLHPMKSTENSRIILGVTAAGGDPRNIGGHNLIAGLDDLEYLKIQGNNGPIWALIALDCKEYALPASSTAKDPVTREKLVACILAMQNPDGGWGLMRGETDVDMTAMALQSLAPYRKDPRVEAAMQNGFSVLSAWQQDDGGYTSFGSDSCESSAQVIVAMTAAGLDPAKDPRFIKNGVSVLDNLCSFQVQDGFCHTKTMPEVNPMATEQAYYALTAYERFCAGRSSLYDMRS